MFPHIGYLRLELSMDPLEMQPFHAHSERVEQERVGERDGDPIPDSRKDQFPLQALVWEPPTQDQLDR